MTVAPTPTSQPVRRPTHYLVRVLLTALLIASTSAAARAGEITDENVDAAIAAAKTPADHEALAAFFTKKAEAALASAQAHTRMTTSYTGKSRQSIVMHCRTLATSYRKQAQDYTALAKEEEHLAKGTTKPAPGGMKGM